MGNWLEPVLKDLAMEKSGRFVGAWTKVLPSLGGQAVVGLYDKGVPWQPQERVVAGAMGEEDG